LFVAKGADAGAYQYHQIEIAQALAVEPETLAYQALYTIPLDGVTGVFY